jgi:hypothetical protein
MHRFRRSLVVVLCLASAVVAISCGSNTSTTTPTPPVTDLQTYQGFWDVGHAAEIETGTCIGYPDLLGTFVVDGQITVDSTGHFTYPNSSTYPTSGTGYPGAMDLSTGAWSFSGNTGGCQSPLETRTISASGTCTSAAKCTGTFTTTSSGGGTASGTVNFSR